MGWGSSAKGGSLTSGGLKQQILPQNHLYGAGQSGEHFTTPQPQPDSPYDIPVGELWPAFKVGSFMREEVRRSAGSSPGIPTAEQT